MGVARSHGPPRREQGLDNWVASTACETVATTELHVTGDLLAKQVEPEPPKALWTGPWQRRQTTKTTPMSDAPLELELIDLPPAPASALLMSNLEWCIALRLVYGAGPRDKLPHAPYLSVSLLSHVSVVPCVLPTLVFPRPDHQSQAPRQ